MRRIAVLDAPSNLGLRPPSPGTVPGCAKAPGALRDHALVARLGALDAGCLVPPRYDPEGWRPGDGVCQADEIADYTIRLADRISKIIGRGDFPLVLGGDCSVVLGAGLAMRRRRAAEGGRYGLVFIDGHSDFRHAGNAEYIGAAAGEDLALLTGRGQHELTNIDGLRPYLREEDVVVLGIRDHDEYRMDLRAAGIVFRTVPQIRAEGPGRTAAWAIEELGHVDGFWVHVDVDVLDPAAMPAVDAPDPGGIAFVELEQMIADLVTRPACLGMEVTVFDPDYDPDGRYAAEVVDTLVGGLRPIWELSQPELGSEPEQRADPQSDAEEQPGTEAQPRETAQPKDATGSEDPARPEVAAKPEDTAEPEDATEPEDTAELEEVAERGDAAERDTAELADGAEPAAERTETEEPENSTEPGDPESAEPESVNAEPVGSEGAAGSVADLAPDATPSGAVGSGGGPATPRLGGPGSPALPSTSELGLDSLSIGDGTRGASRRYGRSSRVQNPKESDESAT